MKVRTFQPERMALRDGYRSRVAIYGDGDDVFVIVGYGATRANANEQVRRAVNLIGLAADALRDE